MASTDARPVPIKGVAYRHGMHFWKNDSTLLTSITGADTKVSKDNAAFSACTNEFTETGSDGCGYIDLTSTEMNADIVTIKSTCTNTGAVPYIYYLYPEEAGDIRANLTPLDTLVMHSGTAQAGGASTITLASGATATDDLYKGEMVKIYSGTGAGQVRVIIGYVGTTKVATVGRAWLVSPDATSVYAVMAIQSPPLDANLGVKLWTGTSSGMVNVASGKVPATLASTDVTGNVAADLQTIKTQTVTAAAAVTFPTSLASPTNITAATGIVLSGVTHTNAVIPTVTTTTTATNLTNLPSVPANWLTAAGIAASALNGKGDWPVGKTGYSLTATTGLGNQTANITGNLSGSVGSVTGAVGSVTASVTAGTVSDKTGYSLTATTGLGNQTANITGNLSGSVGSVTGAVGSVTGAVGSVTGSVGSVTGAVGSVTGNVGGNVVGSVGSVTGAVSSVTAAVTLPSIPAGWITAAGIATGAIDADALASDAVTAIWAGSTAPTSSTIATAVHTTQMTESYNADGTAPTLAQAIFVTMQRLTEFAISGTTITVKKLDGSTSALTLSLNDATTPTSSTRAT
jgi:hypothetical protein